MEGSNVSIKKYILKFGVILGITSVLYNIIIYLTGNIISGKWFLPLISAIILISVIISGIYSYKLANNSFLKLSNSIKIGLGVSLLGGLIVVIWKIFLFNIIEPDMMGQALSTRQEQIITSNPNISQEKLNQSMAVAEKLNSLYIKVLYSLIETLILGFLITLIGGIIMRKQRNPF
ncbi:hypothetical protein AWE51_13550 [Aquimarina aggregata]|uniref:DUF4199 domain-containing protein n=2 Tax=Aquimarina aggregata TaxID=1642818 RepID=A0A162XGA2_9FLAO|nr:hypothetical protein AWE51_13550 [Aquimarina aggregata]